MRRSNIVKLSAGLCLLVILASAFVFVKTAVFAASTIQVLSFESNGATTTNTIYPHIEVVNTGTSAISLTNIKVRYYYTEDGTQSQSFWCDWSPAGSSNVTGTFTRLSTPVNGADLILKSVLRLRLAILHLEQRQRYRQDLQNLTGRTTTNRMTTRSTHPHQIMLPGRMSLAMSQML